MKSVMAKKDERVTEVTFLSRFHHTRKRQGNHRVVIECGYRRYSTKLVARARTEDDLFFIATFVVVVVSIIVLRGDGVVEGNAV